MQWSYGRKRSGAKLGCASIPARRRQKVLELFYFFSCSSGQVNKGQAVICLIANLTLANELVFWIRQVGMKGLLEYGNRGLAEE